MRAPPRIFSVALAFIAAASLLACESSDGSMFFGDGWKEWIAQAVTKDTTDSDRQWELLNCWRPASWHGESLIASAYRVTAVRILGKEADNARRYEADIEITPNLANSSPTVQGLKAGTANATVAGVATRGEAGGKMYLFPWKSAVTETHWSLVARSGAHATIDPAVRDVGIVELLSAQTSLSPTLSRLEKGASWTGKFGVQLTMGSDDYSRDYDELVVAARAGETLKLRIVSQTASPIGAWLAPPVSAFPHQLATAIVPANGAGELLYQAPVDGELRLVIWKGKLDPAGSYTVSR